MWKSIRSPAKPARAMPRRRDQDAAVTTPSAEPLEVATEATDRLRRSMQRTSATAVARNDVPEPPARLRRGLLTPAHGHTCRRYAACSRPDASAKKPSVLLALDAVPWAAAVRDPRERHVGTSRALGRSVRPRLREAVSRRSGQAAEAGCRTRVQAAPRPRQPQIVSPPACRFRRSRGLH